MTAILDILKTLDETRGGEIEDWLAAKRAERAPHIYTSVDLRHSGVRLAPVDTNLFPAGFNNLSPNGRARAGRFFAYWLAEHLPQARRILIVPENHTRNLGYLANLSALLSIIEGLGLDVRLGSLAAAPGGPILLDAPDGRALTEYPLRRTGDTLTLEDGFTPDLILLNNDMTSGPPALLESLAQPVVPPVSMGWWQRRKSVHFTRYAALAADFCKTFGLDPWLLAARFHRCGMVDFKEGQGLGCIAGEIERMLTFMHAKYAEYGIEGEPYVYVKAESGTYGMGILTARSPDDVLDLNKKARNKMQVIKEGARVSEVIIQEGIHTADRVDGHPAEPMIYLLDGIPAGGMFRVNAGRDAYGNLNAAGMAFTGMCDEAEDAGSQWKAVRDCNFRSFGIVAAIAALAAAREDYTIGKCGEGI